MKRKLPPLNSLRAFESAARHLSFTRAADELAVTQSAISHQVTALEEWAGVPLFKRQGRAMVLTEAAVKFLPAVSAALDQIALAGRKLQAVDPTHGWLTVADMDVWIATFEDQAGALGSDIDVAIRYGRGDWPGLASVRIMSEELFPVCAPRLAASLKTPADLAHATLLHDELREDWAMWFAAADLAGVDTARGPGFDDSGLLIQAAIEGLGVALGRSVLVKGDLDAGRLVRPFDVALTAEFAYYLVFPPDLENAPKIETFRTWLLATARATG